MKLIPALFYADPATLIDMIDALSKVRGPRKQAFAPIVEQLAELCELKSDELPDLPADVVLADADGELFLTIREVDGEVWLAPFSERDSIQVTRSRPADDGSTAVGMFNPDGRVTELPLRAVGVWRQLGTAGITHTAQTNIHDIDATHFPVLRPGRPQQ